MYAYGYQIVQALITDIGPDEHVKWAMNEINAVNVPGTTTKDVMDMVLVTQYFDTMKENGTSSKNSVVFIPYGPGVVHDVAAQICDGLL
ncbi:hypothetical protein GIB67_003945 [Kingdonia uniflora]|uniref:Uncharacterized protein n=1 Tax=Kingdonia uniflora TaxID=39325 RepID=A0A7J7LX50_9MAGN|nr:hypothetical protein GIB67_003945 [Kingdonia uniflora]